MHLVPGKAIAPGEVDMLDAVERAREANKLERVASFRQLQGISKQLNYITNGDMTVDSFSLPSSCNVRPVGANERRIFVNVGDRCLHMIINDDTGSQVEVVPLDVDDVKLSLLMLDQGSIGTAGVAFSALHLKKVIYAKFDKIHRLIRDLKGGRTRLPWRRIQQNETLVSILGGVE